MLLVDRLVLVNWFIVVYFVGGDCLFGVGFVWFCLVLMVDLLVMFGKLFLGWWWGWYGIVVGCQDWFGLCGFGFGLVCFGCLFWLIVYGLG